MVALSSIWPLAVLFTIVIAGPVPQFVRRVPSPYYTNISSAIQHSTFRAPPVEADTVVVVEPIQRTVYTNTQPAITYVNPEGQPMITQPEETIFSTSFMSKTVETSASSAIPGASILNPSQVSSMVETSLSSTQSLAQPEVSSTALSLQSNLAKLPTTLDKSSTTTGTEYGGPQFTYIPGENDAEPTASTAATATEVQTTGTVAVVSSTAGSSSDIISCSGSSNKHHHRQNSTLASPSLSTSTALPATVPPQDSSSTATTAAQDGSSLVVVTQTYYTTIFPTSASAKEPDTTLSSLSSSSTPPLAIPTLTERPGVSVSSALSSSVPLPSTSLSPPPAVIETQTSAQTSASTQVNSATTTENGQPTTSSAPVGLPSETSISSSPVSEPTLGLQPTSKFGGGFVYPTQQPAPATTPPIPILSTADVGPSEPAETTPAHSISTSNLAASTSDLPLIVTPINPSQIFTVTVTATATEKETVTETATVTA